MNTLVLLPGLDGTGVLFENLQEALNPRLDVLLGESFSGPIAIRIAADSPPGLCGLVLAVSFARNPLPWLGWLRRGSARIGSPMPR